MVGRGVMERSVCAGALRSHHISAVSLGAHLVEQGEAHRHGVHGTMAARVALALELSAATRCRCMKAGRTHRSLSSMVLVCWALPPVGLVTQCCVLVVMLAQRCSATCQGMALAHMWFSRGSWSPRASETPGCGKLISPG